MLFTGYSHRTLIAFSLALLVHLMLFAALLISWAWPSKSQPAKQDSASIIQATVVNKDKVLAGAEQQAAQKTLQSEATELKVAQAQHQQQAAAEQARQEAKQRREQEQKQQQEQARLKRLEAQRKAREAEARRKAEAERKRAEEEKRRAEAERREKQRLEEQRRRAEAKRKAEEARQRAEAARRKAEAERRQRERELQARLEAEQNAAQERQAKADISRFITQVQRRVQRYWIRPPHTHDDLVVLLQVELLPNGEVRGVKVVQSSGVRTFDRSAQAAVYRAAPLPVPTNPAAAERLLPRFNFRFIPGG